MVLNEPLLLFGYLVPRLKQPNCIISLSTYSDISVNNILGSSPTAISFQLLNCNCVEDTTDFCVL